MPDPFELAMLFAGDDPSRSGAGFGSGTTSLISAVRYSSPGFQMQFCRAMIPSQTNTKIDAGLSQAGGRKGYAKARVPRKLQLALRRREDSYAVRSADANRMRRIIDRIRHGGSW